MAENVGHLQNAVMATTNIMRTCIISSFNKSPFLHFIADVTVDCVMISCCLSWLVFIKITISNIMDKN
jgi:hypothetical protein